MILLCTMRNLIYLSASQIGPARDRQLIVNRYIWPARRKNGPWWPERVSFGPREKNIPFAPTPPGQELSSVGTNSDIKDHHWPAKVF